MATFLEAGLKPGMLALALAGRQYNFDSYQNADIPIGTVNLSSGMLDAQVIRVLEPNTGQVVNWEGLAFGSEDPKSKRVLNLLNLGLKPNQHFRNFYRPGISDPRLEKEMLEANISVMWEMENGKEIYISVKKSDTTILEYSAIPGEYR